MTFNPSITLALTGGIACGKSETGRIFSDEGFAVLDTDTVAHELMRAGTPVFEQVVTRFGKSVVGEDGELDRRMLGGLVFADSATRSILNSLVHPAVISAVERWVDEQSGDAAVLVPLLFEVGWLAGWTSVVCVSANEPLVFQRLKERGMSHEEARRRIEAQMPLAEKEEKSNFVIENNGSLDELRAETIKVLERVRQQRK